jgi:beta-galactosidase
VKTLRRTALFFAATALVGPGVCPASRPLVGAQVWFAPGEYDQPEEIDRVFRTMAEQRLSVARVSLVRNYIETSPGHWDFTLFDRVFAAAEKHNIKIAATLWPHGKVPPVGEVPASDAELATGEVYLQKVVGRYRSSPALDTWILRNEPGQVPANNPLAVAKFRVWLKARYKTIDALNRAWLGASMWPYREPFQSFDEIAFDSRWQAISVSFWPVPLLDWKAFWREHVAWYLEWIATRVRALDGRHLLHTNGVGGGRNPGAVSQEFPRWRNFLDTLGISAYPQQYTEFGHASYTNCLAYATDLLRGAMEPKPVWITETPGGTVSLRIFAERPIPTARPAETAQWVWTGIGGGAERILFWLLNARHKSREVGEFGMLDYLDRPSDRLEAVSAAVRTIESHAALFDAAKPLESPVTLIASLDSMALIDVRVGPTAPARERNAHIHCLLGLHRTLGELGLNVRVKHIHEYDWRAKSPKPRLAILPHAIAIPEEQARDVEAFVRNGNSVLATGLSGFHGPEGRFWPMAKTFPLEGVFGARPREVRTLAETAKLEMLSPPLTVPAYAWVTEIYPGGAQVIGSHEGRPAAVRYKAGQGESVWIPSPIGVAALHGDNKPLAALLRKVVEPVANQFPFRFTEHQPDMLLRTMQSGASYITVVANTSAETRSVRMEKPSGLSPKVIWGKTDALIEGAVQVPARDTVVLGWQ